jgi:hypothetical protein
MVELKSTHRNTKNAKMIQGSESLTNNIECNTSISHELNTSKNDDLFLKSSCWRIVDEIKIENWFVL